MLIHLDAIQSNFHSHQIGIYLQSLLIKTQLLLNLEGLIAVRVHAFDLTNFGEFRS